MEQTISARSKYVFVFLELFAAEGGIQSYNQNLLRAYRSLLDTAAQSLLVRPSAEIFVLRDGPDCDNPLDSSSSLTFHYFQSKDPMVGRIGLTVALLRCMLWQRPQRVFCGHVNLATMVFALCKPLGIPYTVLTHGKEVWDPMPNLTLKAIKQARTIWTVSRYTRDRASIVNGINPSQFQFLPGAVDGDAFTPGPKSQALVEKYNLAGSKVLMTVARLWSGDIYKGVDVTIRALPKVAQVFREVKYLVIGRGDDRPRLEKLAQDLGVGDRVIFAGFVPTEELVDHYRLADAYIMPSQEGFGIVYLEAMACGVPVLAGDGDGSADPLQDGRLGWQVPHRNPEAVAAACIQILKGGDIRCDGEWLRQEAIGAFGKGALTKRLAELLDPDESS